MIVVALGLAFLAGTATTAWINRDHTKALRAELTQAHRDLANANGRAAVGATKAEHARAQLEWGGRWQ